jgi:hypothetical protein
MGYECFYCIDIRFSNKITEQQQEQLKKILCKIGLNNGVYIYSCGLDLIYESKNFVPYILEVLIDKFAKPNNLILDGDARVWGENYDDLEVYRIVDNKVMSIKLYISSIMLKKMDDILDIESEAFIEQVNNDNNYTKFIRAKSGSISSYPQSKEDKEEEVEE